jgi:hypothetical protein
MTVQGIIVLILIGLWLLFWLLDLVRRDRLYVGYGVVFIISILGVILILSLPPLLAVVTRLVGAIFPASALTLLALCFIVVMLVYVLTQVTIVSNRLAVVVQELAVQRAKEAASIAAQRKAPAHEEDDKMGPDPASSLQGTYDPSQDEIVIAIDDKVKAPAGWPKRTYEPD